MVLYEKCNLYKNHFYFLTNDYREALKVSEAILDTSCDMNYKWMAMYVKAESLFNMCDFEHAMVFYLRAKRLAPTSVSEMISVLMLWSYNNNNILICFKNTELLSDFRKRS